MPTRTIFGFFSTDDTLPMDSYMLPALNLDLTRTLLMMKMLHVVSRFRWQECSHLPGLARQSYSRHARTASMAAWSFCHRQDNLMIDPESFCRVD